MTLCIKKTWVIKVMDDVRVFFKRLKVAYGSMTNEAAQTSVVLSTTGVQKTLRLLYTDFGQPMLLEIKNKENEQLSAALT